MDRFRNTSFHHVRDADGRIGNLLVREDLLGGIEDGSDEALMGDRHLIVFGEHRDDALLLEMAHRDLLGVGLNERKVCRNLGLLLFGLEERQESHLVTVLLGIDAHRPLLCDCRKENGFHCLLGLFGLLVARDVLAA